MNTGGLEQVKQIIQKLYDSNSSPELIQETQHQLLLAQKGPQGWQLASFLLDEQDSRAQFVGALTFSIKINDDKFDLPENIRSELLLKLQQALANNYQQFVILKLFSTIITLYIRIYSQWDSFVIDLHHLLSNNLRLELVFFQELVDTYSQGYTGAHQLRAALGNMVPSVLEMIQFGFQSAPAAALGAFYSWCYVFGSEFQPLLPQAIGFLKTSDEEIFEKDCSVLADLYTVHSRGWQKPQKNALIEMVLACTEPFDWERSVPLGRLVISICGQDILTKDMIASQLLPYVTALTSNPSIDEDELLGEVLEFWSQFAEDVVSEGMCSNYNPIFLSVVQTYWSRICIKGKLSNSEWEKVNSFRRDFCDFLELVYPLLGRTIFDTFADNIINNISQSDNASSYNWPEIEASLCSLNGLADIIDDSGEEYKAIEEVFSSSLWTDLNACPIVRVRHTAVNIIGSYDNFFEKEQGRPNLPTALNFLFQSLQISNLQLTASRSIQKLCSSCRTYLTNEVFNFLQVYEPLRFNLDSVAHHRTVSAITYVIEALPMESQVEPLWRLLMMVESSEMQPVDMLKCISQIGKSLKKPTEEYTASQQAAAAEFWDRDPNGIRQNLFMVINEAFNMTSDVFEELCHIFKAGLSEHIPNPFTFSADATLDFMRARRQQGKRDDLPAILGLAGFLISTRAAANQLTPDIVLACMQLESTDAVAQSIELQTTALNKAPEIFLRLPEFENYIELALNALCSNDRFVLIQSSKFWTSLVTEPLCKEVVHSVGPRLVANLALQISGEAERGEVQYFSEILRKFISKHVRLSGILLKKAFIDEPQWRNLRNQDEKTRSMFVSQLQLLRGSSQTKDVVNKFWLFCRGLPEY